jgi:hypothetical protein
MTDTIDGVAAEQQDGSRSSRFSTSCSGTSSSSSSTRR